jgi:hypothetical protein
MKRVFTAQGRGSFQVLDLAEQTTQALDHEAVVQALCELLSNAVETPNAVR